MLQTQRTYRAMDAPHAQRLRPSAPLSFPSAALGVRTFCCQGRFPSLNLPHSHLWPWQEHGRAHHITGSNRVKSFSLLSPEVPPQWQSVRCPAPTGTTPGTTEGRVQKAQMVPCLFMDVCSTRPRSSPIFLPASLDRGGASMSPYLHCLWWRWWGSLTPDYYRCEQHTLRASFSLVFGMGVLSPGLHTH